MIPVYWINLNRDIERRNRLIKQFRSHGILNHRIEAVEHSVGKIGCSLSHIKAIHQAYMDGNEFALICEDDVEIASNPMFQTDIQNLLESFQEPWDVLQLHYVNPNFLEAMQTTNPTKNTMIKGYFMSCAMYLIQRRAMEVFLHTMTTPDDKDLNQYHVKVALDHPRATAEELVYRYLNTYCSFLPLVNVREEFGISSIAMDPNQYINNYKNMELIYELFARRPVSSFTYRVNAIYELPYDMHWCDTKEIAADHVRKINTINPSYK